MERRIKTVIQSFAVVMGASFMLSHQMHGRQDYFFDDDVLFTLLMTF